MLDLDRTMMLYEEFIGYLGKNQSAIQQRPIVQPVVAQRPIPRDLRPRYILIAIIRGTILVFGIVLLWGAHIGRYQGSQSSARTASPNGWDGLNGPALVTIAKSRTIRGKSETATFKAHPKDIFESYGSNGLGWIISTASRDAIIKPSITGT